MFVVTELVVSGTSLYLTDLFIAKTSIAWTRGPSVLHVLFTDRSSFHSLCRSWIFSCVSVTIVYETVPANRRDFRIKLVIHKYNSEFPRIFRQFATCSTSDKKKRNQRLSDTAAKGQVCVRTSQETFLSEWEWVWGWEQILFGVGVRPCCGCLWKDWVTAILVCFFFARWSRILQQRNSTKHWMRIKILPKWSSFIQISVVYEQY